MADAGQPTLIRSTIPGPVGVNWLGPWNNATQYVERSAVSDSGSSWYAVAPSIGIQPINDNGSYWQPLAKGGATGTTGATGATGQPAVTGALPVAADDTGAAQVGVPINGLYKTSAGVVMQRGS